MFDNAQITSGRNGRLSVNRPVRSATANRELVQRANPATDKRLLPSLDSELTLLDIESERGVSVLQSLVLDHLMMHDGPAFWVDSNGCATTTAMHRLAPSRRLLNRIHVARGFTPYQHWAAIRDLPGAVNEHLQEKAKAGACSDWASRPTDDDPVPPTLIVVPAIDAMYRNESPHREVAQSLLARVLAALRRYAEGYDVAVLLTRTREDAFTGPVATAADRTLAVQLTRLGPRFVGDEFETLLYPVDGGEYYQTTLTYWKSILEARAAHAGVDDAKNRGRTAGPDSPGSSAVGHGVTVRGGTDTLTASPLLDAWCGRSSPEGI